MLPALQMMDAFTAVAMYMGLVLGQVGRLRGGPYSQHTCLCNLLGAAWASVHRSQGGKEVCAVDAAFS